MHVMGPCFNKGDTIYFPFDSYDSNGASVTITGLAVTDIEVYKDGSVTQRSSDNGYTLLDTDGIDFDGSVGLHGFSIDTSDNSDAGFWADGSQYWVHINAVTIDGQTVRFTYFLPLGFSLRPTTLGRTLDVATTGEAGMDLGNTTGTLTGGQLGVGCFAAGAVTAGAIATDAIGSAELATTAVNEIRDAVNGGAYSLDTDSNGRIRVVDGTGAGEINTASGAIVQVDQLGAQAKLDVNAEVDNALDTAIPGSPTANSINERIKTIDDHDLVTKVPDTLSLSNIKTQNADALSDIHMDHLLAVDYNPASKPGVATALLNELVENNGGVSRFTSAALDQTWSVGTRALTAATNITSDGSAITMSSSGVIGTVNLVNTLTTYTGNTVQTGDIFARLGAPAGASVSADIATRSSHSAADVWSSASRTLTDGAEIKKNAAFSNFRFKMVLASDGKTPATGKTVTAKRALDNGGFVAAGGTVTEVSNGYYDFDGLAADTNCDVGTWLFQNADCLDTGFTFKTRPS